MDKTTFEKEILNKTQPNYLLGLFNQAADDRLATIKNLAVESRRDTRIDVYHLYSLSSIIRGGGLSGITESQLEKAGPRLSINCCDWYDQTHALMARVTAIQKGIKEFGILHGHLAYLSRR